MGSQVMVNSAVNKIWNGQAIEAPWARDQSTAKDRHYYHIHISVGD